MPRIPTAPCSLHNARIRCEKEADLQRLVRVLFERRHHHMVAGSDKKWMTVELVQSLRRKSRVYREHLSSQMSGPLPFALGYLRLHEGAVDLTTDEVPASVAPRVLLLLLSEYLEPGATLIMDWEGETQRWVVRGEAEVERLDEVGERGEDAGKERGEG